MTQVGKCCQLSNRTCHSCIIAHTYDNAYPLDDGTERPSSTTKCSSLSVWMEGFCRVLRPFSGTDGGLRRSRPGEAMKVSMRPGRSAFRNYLADVSLRRRER